MKYFKNLLILSSLFFFISYFVLGAFFYVYFSKPNIPLVKDLNFSNPLYTKLTSVLLKKGFGDLYHFNLQGLFNDNPNFILRFSNNDIKSKDSIYNLIKTNEVIILEDWMKNWRNFNIINNKEEFKAKYKLHGSSVGTYNQGYESFTIKSETEINGYKNFKLLNGLKSNYFNIFLNEIAHSFNLIAEDSGEIIVTNSLGRFQDFFQYNIFDQDYLVSKFKMNKPSIIKRNTFFEKNIRNWHASELDDVSYNIDLDLISKKDYELWKKNINGTNEIIYDEKYMGDFLALIQLFNDPHQINGDNDRWVINEDKIYPVYRNENSLQLLSGDEINQNSVFANFYYSSSYVPYMKALANPKVINFRNQAFKKIIDEKLQINNRLDSIYHKYIGIHKRYNKNYIKIKYQHSLKKRILSSNFNNIRSYLNGGKTMIYYDGDKLKITSTRNNILSVLVDGQEHSFLPKSYIYNSASRSLEEKLHELVVNNIKSIDSLKIYDSLLNISLEYEKDYNILLIN